MWYLGEKIEVVTGGDLTMKALFMIIHLIDVPAHLTLHNIPMPPPQPSLVELKINPSLSEFIPA